MEEVITKNVNFIEEKYEICYCTDTLAILKQLNDTVIF